MKRQFHKLIETKRKQRNLSVPELAKLIGVSRVQVWSYETNRAIPSLLIAQKISKTLGFSLDTVNFDESIKRHVRTKCLS